MVRRGRYELKFSCLDGVNRNHLKIKRKFSMSGKEQQRKLVSVLNDVMNQ